MKKTFLVITSIADEKNAILNQYAVECKNRGIPFVMVGDTKSPNEFFIDGVDYYSIEKQCELDLRLPLKTPVKHYSRKNIGYLISIMKGAEIIIETDDDNLPYNSFWDDRCLDLKAHTLKYEGWVNVYKYFSESNIWPRGFPLQNVLDELQELKIEEKVHCPIQQGLADDNPDVDAIYRMVLPLPMKFNTRGPVALSDSAMCPFNSQNTTWFKEAFPLLYLPSFCSFRMTDIWRSFVAQRIAWTCGWSILFHNSSVYQIRNEHSIIKDFEDEISGYLYNTKIMDSLMNLELKNGVENIYINLFLCYQELVNIGVIHVDELDLVKLWINDLKNLSI